MAGSRTSARKGCTVPALSLSNRWVTVCVVGGWGRVRTVSSLFPRYGRHMHIQECLHARVSMAVLRSPVCVRAGRLSGARAGLSTGLMWGCL